jgi:hypothetical protein
MIQPDWPVRESAVVIGCGRFSAAGRRENVADITVTVAKYVQAVDASPSKTTMMEIKLLFRILIVPSPASHHPFSASVRTLAGQNSVFDRNHFSLHR